MSQQIFVVFILELNICQMESYKERYIVTISIHKSAKITYYKHQ